MKRASLFLIVGLSALGCCAQAFALGASAPIAVTANIVQAGGISIVGALVLPTVTASAVSPNASFAGSVPSAGTTGALAGSAPNPAGNATLTIHGQAGDAVSMAVPESFQVVRSGGTEALTVKTNTNAAYGLSGDGVVLGGTGAGGASMSVNVGGAITLASSGATPGAYEGLLVVVVQYN